MYESIEHMWKAKIVDEQGRGGNGNGKHPIAAKMVETRSKSEHGSRIGICSKETWYRVAVRYWDRQPATVDGVLGGYEGIHETEIGTSRAILTKFKSHMPRLKLALDCGAGIGRVTKTLLKGAFEHVDLLEPSDTQINKARKYCQQEARKFYHQGLETFQYEEPYDCIWIQWVLCYLTDGDIYDFLVKTKRDGLTRDESGRTGLIFVKENTSD